MSVHYSTYSRPACLQWALLQSQWIHTESNLHNHVRETHPYFLLCSVLIDDRQRLVEEWEIAGGAFIHHTAAVTPLHIPRKRGTLMDDDCSQIQTQEADKAPTQVTAESPMTEHASKESSLA